MRKNVRKSKAHILETEALYYEGLRKLKRIRLGATPEYVEEDQAQFINARDPVEIVSWDVMEKLFAYLPYKDLCSASTVSHLWRDCVLASSKMLWQPEFVEHVNGKQLKAYIKMITRARFGRISKVKFSGCKSGKEPNYLQMIQNTGQEVRSLQLVLPHNSPAHWHFARANPFESIRSLYVLYMAWMGLPLQFPFGQFKQLENLTILFIKAPRHRGTEKPLEQIKPLKSLTISCRHYYDISSLLSELPVSSVQKLSLRNIQFFEELAEFISKTQPRSLRVYNCYLPYRTLFRRVFPFNPQLEELELQGLPQRNSLPKAAGSLLPNLRSLKFGSDDTTSWEIVSRILDETQGSLREFVCDDNWMFPCKKWFSFSEIIQKCPLLESLALLPCMGLGNRRCRDIRKSLASSNLKRLRLRLDRVTESCVRSLQKSERPVDLSIECCEVSAETLDCLRKTFLEVKLVKGCMRSHAVSTYRSIS